MNRTRSLYVLLMFAGAFAGCATQPKPPAPVASAPMPSPPPSAPYAPPAPGAVRSGPLPGTVQDFVVNVGDRVYFDLNAYVVRPDAIAILRAQADWLNRYPAVHIRIEGNCDERGTREYNLALGARRAESVKAFLIGREVDPGRISTISYGKEHPIDPGSGEDAWSHNRNAHVAIAAGAK